MNKKKTVIDYNECFKRFKNNSPFYLYSHNLTLEFVLKYFIESKYDVIIFR